MGLVKIDESILTAIAGAIRSKLGVATTYKPNQMASAIGTIEEVNSSKNGQVVVDGHLANQTSRSITENGTYNTTTNNSVTVNVEHSFVAEDEGKVVSNGALVSQTSITKTANGTYDTTTNNEVVVNVANSYTAGDEGKVVSSGALVAQTSATKTANGTYTTTTNNQIIVAIPLANGVSF